MRPDPLGESATPNRLEALRRAVALHPTLPDGWRLLADVLEASGQVQAAHEARSHFIKVAANDRRLIAAARGLNANDLPLAESLLRLQLRAYPTDVVAIRMLAEVAARLRRYGDAQVLLERCLELAPEFHEARHNYCVVLFRQMKTEAALEQVDGLLSQGWSRPACKNLKAAILATLGDYSESIETYAAVLVDFPEQPKVWMSYGHALKTAGRQDESIAAYRRAISLQPGLGEAYWSLANLKTFRFAAEEVAAMHVALADDALPAEDRVHFEFALGKALEDAASYEASFAHYAAGAALRRRLVPYYPDELTAHVRRVRQLYTPEFLAERAGVGADAQDPIFIVGLPRAGSTLVEQILASHPLIEGTMELPDIPAMARELAGQRRADGEPTSYLHTLASLSPSQLRALGERYLAQTRIQRKTDAPFFIDKMPNNCMHVGLIHLILPNARIIDARRHPLGCLETTAVARKSTNTAKPPLVDKVSRTECARAVPDEGTNDHERLAAQKEAVWQGRVTAPCNDYEAKGSMAGRHLLLRPEHFAVGNCCRYLSASGGFAAERSAVSGRVRSTEGGSNCFRRLERRCRDRTAKLSGVGAQAPAN